MKLNMITIPVRFSSVGPIGAVYYHAKSCNKTTFIFVIISVVGPNGLWHLVSHRFQSSIGPILFNSGSSVGFQRIWVDLAERETRKRLICFGKISFQIWQLQFTGSPIFSKFSAPSTSFAIYLQYWFIQGWTAQSIGCIRYQINYEDKSTGR